MKLVKIPIKRKEVILALGAESAGVFAVYKNNSIFVSENFGDLLDENNFIKYKKAVLDYFKKEKIKPDVILTDLHPLYKTTILGEELAKKHNAPHVKVQHHIAHIFSSVGDKIIHNTKYIIPDTFLGIAMDGTGYGLDGNIWGGEVFKFKVKSEKLKVIERIGSLEEQIMIGGDLAVKEPARMPIAILAKTKNQKPKTKIYPVKYSARRNLTGQAIQNLKLNSKKDFIYKYVKKFYARNEFELLYNQMEQNFNCQKTTSAGRVLDAVSVLLGFAGNERNYKHEAAKKLEENSSKPYFLEPKITSSVIASSPSADGERGNPVFPAIDTGLSAFGGSAEDMTSPPLIPRNDNDKRMILQTTPLFEYLIKNIKRNRRRLAATTQYYLAKGFYEIIKQNQDSRFLIYDSCFAAGGMANNKIISSYLEKHGVYLSKKIPRGDEGIAAGQIVYYLLNNY